MSKKILSGLFTIIFVCCQAQESEKYNLGFENQKEDAALSEGWFKWGNYELTIDTVAFTGRKSGKITSSES